MIKLTVYLSDGRELSGTYDYLSAGTRLDFASRLPEYVGFDIEDAV